MACGEKDKDPARFARTGDAKEEGVNVIAAPCPVTTHRKTGETLSATFLREYINNNNFDEFLEYVPDSSLKHAEEVFALLGGERGLQESLSDAIFRWVEENLDEISTVSGGFEGGPKKKKKRQQPIIMREEEPNESEDELEEEIYRYIANNLSI
jgi:predicted nucleotidyltransferase